jgi:hypothetical protein
LKYDISGGDPGISIDIPDEAEHAGACPNASTAAHRNRLSRRVRGYALKKRYFVNPEGLVAMQDLTPLARRGIRRGLR